MPWRLLPVALGLVLGSVDAGSTFNGGRYVIHPAAIDVADVRADAESTDDTTPSAADLNYASSDEAYTDYQCLVNASQRGTSCGIDKPNPAFALQKLLKQISSAAEPHVLIYGPSYLREIGDAIVRAGGGSSNLTILGENNPSKTCYCGIYSTGHGKACPCADYTTDIIYGGKIKLTKVFNYAKLQTKAKSSELKKLLNENDFTHAIVMEPHKSCYFYVCGGSGVCTGCEEMDMNGVYGTDWSDEMWEILEGGLCEGDCSKHKKLVHVVPWSIEDNYTVAHPEFALRTADMITKYACAASPYTDSSGDTDLSYPSTGLPTISAAHQCLTVCQTETKAGESTDMPPKTCRDGSPTRIAIAALRWFNDMTSTVGTTGGAGMSSSAGAVSKQETPPRPQP